MDTKEIIANQLAENTGIAMMDSGGSCGRAWQRNKLRAEAHGMTIPEMFEQESRAWWDGYGVTLSTYHWMVEHLDHRADFQDRYDRWVHLSWIGLDRYDRGHETNSPATVDAYVDKMIARDWMEPHPEFGGWTNTYNHENLLSQDLQFRLCATTDKHPLGETSLVFMSTHNGADARGGYSDFKIYECDPWEMWDWDQFNAHCPQCEVHPADPASTIFDETPYVAECSGWFFHRSGEWTDSDGYNMSREESPLIYLDRGEMPDEFVQTGPVCPIHLCNMEVS